MRTRDDDDGGGDCASDDGSPRRCRARDAARVCEDEETIVIHDAIYQWKCRR